MGIVQRRNRVKNDTRERRRAEGEVLFVFFLFFLVFFCFVVVQKTILRSFSVFIKAEPVRHVLTLKYSISLKKPPFLPTQRYFCFAFYSQRNEPQKKMF